MKDDDYWALKTTAEAQGVKLDSISGRARLTLALILIGLLFTGFPVIGTASLADIVASASPSVVFVWTKNANRDISKGTGFVLTSKGLIATAEHVVDHWEEIVVRFKDGDVKTATAVWFSRRSDVALLSVRPPVPKPLTLYNPPDASAADILFNKCTQCIRQGDEVIVLGFPFSSTLGYEEITVTRGIVSAFRRESHTALLQIDAGLNAGTSGGPVFNTKGQVIGLVTSKVSDASSIGFAVNVAELKIALESYRAGRFPFDVCLHSGSPQTPSWLCEPTVLFGWEERGRTRVPLREAAQTFGAETSYDNTTGRIRVSLGDRMLELRVGSSSALANGSTVDVGEKIRSDYVWVPLRLLVESLGGQLSFDSRNRTAYVDMPR